MFPGENSFAEAFSPGPPLWGDITPRLQKTTCDVLDHLQPLATRLSEKPAIVRQLSNGMGDLQPIVKYLRCVEVGSMTVLQTVSLCFPGVKP